MKSQEENLEILGKKSFKIFDRFKMTEETARSRSSSTLILIK